MLCFRNEDKEICPPDNGDCQWACAECAFRNYTKYDYGRGSISAVIKGWFGQRYTRRDLLFNGFEGPVKPSDSRDGSEDNSGEQNAEKARSYAGSEALMPPGDYLEILRFRHYTRFWNFESKGKNSRRKSIINSIEVSVILHKLNVVFAAKHLSAYEMKLRIVLKFIDKSNWREHNWEWFSYSCKEVLYEFTVKVQDKTTGNSA